MSAMSFEPVVGPDPVVLILGSMPGVRSLNAREYYAHPRNAFWKILSDLGCCSQADDYGTRLVSLQAHGIALWDVLEACDRTGSLDASIVRRSERPNDIVRLLETHPSIRAVLFNGGAAESAFRRHVLPTLPLTPNERIAFHRMPSTSPAHTLSYSQKLTAWRAVLGYLVGHDG